MPVEISWYLENRIVYARVYGKISSYDDETFDQRIKEYLDQSDGLPVHVITDYTYLETVQTIIGRTMTGNSLTEISKHPALGCLLTIDDKHNPMLKFLTPFTSYALTSCYEQFDTVNKALTYLYKVDTTLPPELTDTNRRTA
jgi:hypothetical protein